MVKLIIDDKEIETEEGTMLLQASLDNGIYIPNLCYLKDRDDHPTSCRLCFVEVNGNDKPVTSCNLEVRDGMKVKTNTPQVRHLQKTAFELLLSAHMIDCRNCPSNKKCDLQKIAKFLHTPLKQKRIKFLERNIKIEEDHPFLRYDPNKCILCGKCIFICSKKHKRPFLAYAKRGLNTYISFFGENDPAQIPCDECYECIDICSVSALSKKTSP